MWRELIARYTINSVAGHTVATVGSIEINIYRAGRDNEDEIHSRHR